jgi:hypothetical protein
MSRCSDGIISLESAYLSAPFLMLAWFLVVVGVVALVDRWRGASLSPDPPNEKRVIASQSVDLSFWGRGRFWV